MSLPTGEFFSYIHLLIYLTFVSLGRSIENHLSFNMTTCHLSPPAALERPVGFLQIVHRHFKTPLAVI